MTKVRIASDFHLDYHMPFSDNYDEVLLPKMKSDKNSYLLLAGDISEARHVPLLMPFYEKLSQRFKHVYVVMGNHDHWNSVHFKTEQEIKQEFAFFENVTLLENETAMLDDDVMLIGCTLWTDYDKENPMAMNIGKYGMLDTSKISSGHFMPEVALGLHKDSINFLEKTINSPEYLKARKRIVMTHHAPSSKSIHSRFATSPLNPCFHSNLEYFMDDNLNLWIHGHVHQNFDYKLYGTRVICNPLGYKGENDAYIKKLVVEL